ncbi:UNVERIFIED_CONTAM: hypothetical protein FKN15_043609 [Acipenser sinensis]
MEVLKLPTTAVNPVQCPLCNGGSGSIGDLEDGEDNLPDEHSLSEEGGGASDQEDSAECDGSSPASAPLTSEEPTANESPGTPAGKEDQGSAERLKEEEEQKEDGNHWNGPGRKGLGVRPESGVHFWIILRKGLNALCPEEVLVLS